jgi:hypothetical protein
VRFEVDDSEVRNLEADLSGAPFRVQMNAKRVLMKGASIIDAAMVVDATGHKGNYFGLPGTSFSTPMQNHVSHEMIGPFSAEIGIEPNGAGSLAHIIVYGSINNAPVYDHTKALTRSTPAIVNMFADAAEESVLGGSQ